MDLQKSGQDISTKLTILVLAIFAAFSCGASGVKGKDTQGEATAAAACAAQPSLAPLVDKVAGAVVNIRTKVKVSSPGGAVGPDRLFEWFFGPRGNRQLPFPSPEREQIQRSMGSGFIIDASGIVATNRHVVEGAEEIEVQLSDERKFDAEIIGSDERTDLAVLRLKNAKGLPAASFGDSNMLRVGDYVVAIGNPFGLDHTVTLGIVSAKERVIGAGPYDEFIQTDASINPGNSGGPLFNLRGEVIGINTAIAPQGQGIGFAIPSSLAKSLIDTLRKEGRVMRGWLGISFQPLTEELAKAFKVSANKGAVVANVSPGSPAAAANIKTGDVILEVNGTKLKSARDLPRLVAALRPGSNSSFLMMREGKQQTLTVKIGEMPEEGGSAAQKGRSNRGPVNTQLGFEVVPLDDQLKQRLNAEGIERGVVVSRIDPNGIAAGALSEGDIIFEVNRNRISSVADFKEKTKEYKSGGRLLLLVFRGGSWTYLVLGK
jgi:serine protease Do